MTGTVKSANPDGFVVRGVEKDKEREWAFSLDDRTAVRKSGQTAAKADLKEGDRVTVNYTERDGKIVAQSVTVTGGATGSRPPPAERRVDVPRTPRGFRGTRAGMRAPHGHHPHTRRHPMSIVDVVVTSGSGDGRAVDIARHAFSRLVARGYAGRLRCFRTAADVRAWARRCPPAFSHLACVGGDATLSAAAGAAARLAVPLVPVPSGFGNVFGRALGYSGGADSIVDLIEHGLVWRADVGRAGKELFLCHQSYGFLEDIQRAVEENRAPPRSRVLRRLAYYAMAGKILREVSLSSIAVDVDGARVAEDGALVTIANVETYRGFLTLTPNASPFDGLLDICIMPRTTKPRLLARLMALLLKLPGRWKGVRLLRGRRVAVTVNGRTQGDIHVARAALPVVLPPGTEDARLREGARGPRRITRAA